MAEMILDEYGFLEEPCLSCDKARTDDLFYEWYCDEKECPYKAKNEHKDTIGRAYSRKVNQSEPL